MSSAQSSQPTAAQVTEATSSATAITSALLAEDHKAHAVFGGMAVRFLGGNRMTRDVDILVHAAPLEIRAKLLQMDKRYSINSHNKLVFEASNGLFIEVELLRGGTGPGISLKLPDPTVAPTVSIQSVIVLHPGVLVITKIKRWMNLAESTRPQSIMKAGTDKRDILFLLKWLVEQNRKVDFQSYEAIKPKDELLPAFRLFYRLVPESETVMQGALDSADFQDVRQ